MQRRPRFSITFAGEVSLPLSKKRKNGNRFCAPGPLIEDEHRFPLITNGIRRALQRLAPLKTCYSQSP
jgi:hypothetical protein